MTPFLLIMAAEAGGYGVRCVELHDMTLQPAPIEAVSADSTLSPSSRYGAQQAFDQNPATAWCEGDSGTGEGKTIKIVLSEPQPLGAIFIHGGYFKSADLLAANGRISSMQMTASHSMSGQTHSATLSFSDPTVVPATDPCMPGEPADPATWFEVTQSADGAMVYTAEGLDTPVDVIELTISGVFPGSKYTDTCISEIVVLTRDLE